MRVLASICLLFLAACGSSTDLGGGSAGLGISPKPGLWQGSDLSFRLVGGKVTELTLAPHSCTGVQSCKGSVSGPLAGAWQYGTAFHATPANGTVGGNFVADTAIAGTLQLSTGTCCTVTAAWSAVWVGDGDAGISSGGDTISGADAGGGSDTNSGSDSSTDTNPLPWGGESFGTIHPGPAQTNASPAPLGCLASDQQSAIGLLNNYRNAVGAPVIQGNCALSQASKAHADFYIAHVSKYNSSGLSVHEEDSSYGAGFTGVNFWDRDMAAGFAGGGTGGEVIAFEGTPPAALKGWIDTVYHRLPLLSPTTQVIGYGSKSGGGTSCDVIDSSGRNGLKTDPIIVWPWPGQHNVDASWNGLEGPTPKAPPGGFPSGPVITAQFWKTTTISAHELSNADGTAIAHTWLDYKTDPNLANLAPETVALYANKPLSAGTYSVKLTLTNGDVLAWRFSVGP
jgi:uncharacterized protein YkwD